MVEEEKEEENAYISHPFLCKNVATNRADRKLFRACADTLNCVGKQLVYHQTDDEQLSGLSVTHDCQGRHRFKGTVGSK